MAGYLKTCKICGKEFIAPQQKVDICYDEHTLKCVVCGKEFPISRKRLIEKDHKTTCSKECTVKLREQTNMEKYGGVAPACNQEVREKTVKTNVEKYGGVAPACSDKVKEKSRQTSLNKYGVEYYTQTDEYKERSKQTFLENYGVDSPFKSKEIREKIEQTNLKRYGVKNVFEKEYQQEHILPEYEKKTGYKHPSSNPKNIKTRMDALKDKYGGIGLSSPVIKEHAQATNIERYGFDNPVKNKEIEQKIENTCLEKYGNKCYLQSEDGKKITEEKMIEKYGVPTYFQSREMRLNTILDPSKIDNLEAFNKNPREYIISNYEENLPTLKELAENLGISPTTTSWKINEFGCKDLISYVYSYMEKEVYDALVEIDPDLNIERNTYSVISPYELDLYLPDYKLGIECNPTATHNSTINGVYKATEPKHYKYHQMKTDMCEEKGVFLFHIFGYDWTYHKPVIISMLRNLIGKTKEKIYARNCNVKLVSSTDSSKFLLENHRQGDSKASVRLGLYYNNKLVSLMTFGKIRGTIGTGKEDLTDCYELVRFCNITNTSVVGGASKLFKYFVDNYNPTKIHSFSDRAHTKGNMYQILGFKEIRRSSPSYMWVEYKSDVPYHRTNTQKRNLKHFLNDDTIDLSKTEKQIMEEHGFVQVFDCGTITWEYVNE